jgi:hypothetical protein
MARKIIKPFRNESDSLQIDELTVENRIDRISIYGSIDITRDQEGLALARHLKEILDLTLAELEKEELPERIAVATLETVDNPFA